MTYKKYIKINSKKYGPYYYKSIRKGKKVVSEYIGKTEKIRNKGKEKNKKSKIFFFTISILFSMLILSLLFFNQNSIMLSPADLETNSGINIIKATHLDYNRNEISNIYKDIKDLDKVWSGKIYHNQYLRVTFEKNLTKNNDITVYVRNQQQEENIIGVYEIDKNEKIAEFPIIEEENYYKIYFTDLKETQDTFDLKIINLDNNSEAFLEFDYIYTRVSFQVCWGEHN